MTAKRKKLTQETVMLLDTYMEEHAPVIKTHVWHRVPIGSKQEVTFSVYKNEEWEAFSSKDPQDNLYKMRENANIRLNDASPRIDISIYKDKDSKEEPTPENHYAGIRFGRTEFKFKPFEYTVTVPSCPQYEILERKVDLNNHVFIPFVKYQENRWDIPKNLVFYTNHFGNWNPVDETDFASDHELYDPNCTVNRMILYSETDNDFVYQPADGPAIRKYIFKGMDNYTDSKEVYGWEMICSPKRDNPDFNPMDTLGLLEPHVYKELTMACQPLPAFVEGSVWYKGTCDYEFNQQTHLDDNPTKAYYKLFANKVTPHWGQIRDMYMFPISKECYYGMLVKASTLVEKKYRKFKKVTDDGEEVKQLRYRNEKDERLHLKNPLHKRGDESHVINLGSVDEPRYDTGRP